jgi:adsorption protein B
MTALFPVIDLLAGELLLFAGIWFLVGAVDDLALDFVWLINLLRDGRRFRPAAPQDSVRQAGTSWAGARYAVFVPAWDEAEVIGDMVAHCLRRWPDRSYRLYVGTYANDPGTAEAAERGAAGDPRLRLVPLGLAGPSSKADCLNRIWQAMQRDEAGQGWRFDAVILHDAEDVVHPGELQVYGRWLSGHAFVQIPVRPLIDPGSRLIGGHYADEFAEAHLRKMPVRSRIGVAMPCAGVGCAFRREALQALARASGSDAPFATDSLTEDYELGIRLHELGLRGLFVRERDAAGDLVATRAYFPGELGAAVRQKTRWMIGIALSGWDRTGWGDTVADIWMRARDRRSALAALVLVAGYLGLLLWLVTAVAGMLGLYRAAPPDPAARVLLLVTGCTLVWRLAARAACTCWNHGWREALWSLPRALVSNVIAVMAARRALMAYAASLPGASLPWDKTRHRIPAAMALSPQEADPAHPAIRGGGRG